MSADVSSLPVIDIDSHWTEPPDLWTSRAPARWKDRALRVVKNDQGVEHWVIEDGQFMGPVGYCSIRPDGSKGQGQVAFDSFDEVTPAAIETAPRLDYMDEHGLSAQVVFPNVVGFSGTGVLTVEDEGLRDFCLRAYNDACGEMQAEGKGRLFPMAVLPVWDVRAAVAELERCNDELGLTGFVLTDSVIDAGLPPLHDPHWEPLWEVAQDRGMPCNFHIGPGLAMPRVWGNYEPARLFAAMSTMAQMGNMMCIVNLITSGLLDRYPKLDFVSVESGVGWLPFMLESLDYQFKENGVQDAKLTPTEYFQRQIYGSYWFEQDPSDAIARLGEDNIMFETDFPHATCLYPDVRERMAASVEKFEPRVQRKLLFETAARVYGIPVADPAS